MRPEIVVLVAVVGGALASMGVYRLTPAGRDAGDRTGRGGSFVLGYRVRNWFYWVLGPAFRAVVAARITPLAFNVAAVALGALAGGAFATGHLATAGWAVLLSGLADVFDGEAARGLGVADARGAFVDSTLDRFSEWFAFVGMVAYFDDTRASLLVALALGGSLLVSYTRARGESLGVLCKLGVMQRAERMLLVGLGAIVDGAVCARARWRPGTLLEGAVGAIALGTLVTAVFRTVWIARRLGERG